MCYNGGSLGAFLGLDTNYLAFPFDCNYDNYSEANSAAESFSAQMWNGGGAMPGFIHGSSL